MSNTSQELITPSGRSGSPMFGTLKPSPNLSNIQEPEKLYENIICKLKIIFFRLLRTITIRK